MQFSEAIPTFVITLREGVEAALVVGIVTAYLKKVDRSDLNSWVWRGIGVGLGISLGIGFLFNWLAGNVAELSPVAAPLWEGVFGLAAVVMLSWMLIWMSRQGRAIKGQIEGDLKTALVGSDGNSENNEAKNGWNVFSLILFAVLREGLEIVLLLSAKFQAGIVPGLGAVAGLFAAVGVGLCLFRFGIKINLSSFFRWVGIFLLLIVAGLLVSALAHFDRASIEWQLINSGLTSNLASVCIFPDSLVDARTCILGNLVWDLHLQLPQREFPGIVLRALFGYEEKLYLVEAIAYLGFLIIAGSLYWQSLAQQSSGSSKIAAKSES
jgi:high-affinity iron transporter